MVLLYISISFIIVKMKTVNYPNGAKTIQHKTISYSRRGMSLESDINATNKYYLENDIAAIYKKPTPVTIVNVDYKSRATAKITEAYFQVPSTTDYNGIYNGKYIDFEAKETHNRTAMPLSIIHPHQIEHLRRVIRYGGIGFLIVRFTQYDETYYVDAGKFIDYMNTLKAKSIKYEWFQKNGILIPYNYVIKVNYLKVIKDIYEGDTNEHI